MKVTHAPRMMEDGDLSFICGLFSRFFCFLLYRQTGRLMMKKKDLGVLWEPRARSINYRQLKISDFI